MLLLDLTAVAAFVVASGPSLGLVKMFGLLLAGSLASGGAAALNCYLDRDLDGRMGRTRSRPIPKGVVEPSRGLEFGLLLIGGGALTSLYFLPLLATVFILLGAFGLVYLLIAGVFGLWLLIVDLKLAFDPSKSRAWTAFKVSSPYLAIVFLPWYWIRPFEERLGFHR